MKRSTLIFTHSVMALMSSAQTDFSELNQIKFENVGDYKQHEDKVLQAVNHVLSTPLDMDDAKSLRAQQFLILWMEGTPDYTFTIDDFGLKVSKKNEDMLGVYLAALTKVGIETPGLAEEANRLLVARIVADYVADEANGVKQDKYLKGLVKARENEELAAYIKG